MNQAAAPTMPAPMMDPPSVPKIERRIIPMTGTTISNTMNMVSISKPPEALRFDFASGKGLPSPTTAMI